jgi:Tol biopolymer transport system component
VWLISADGSTAVDLTANFGADALYPSWSPDGTRVAFSSNRGGSFDIWIADLSTLVPDFRP